MALICLGLLILNLEMYKFMGHGYLENTMQAM